MLAALLFAAAAAWTPAEVCANPASPCLGFSANDLSFPLPRDGLARAEVRSAPFHAVILASGARCGFGERERQAAQSHFPDVKVFSHRFGCEDPVEMG
ncbi:MAG TPA: hypothetical protein VFD95_12195, partial [Usitatibacter sp.]|nr:hypothetical protein [Usitatibacter sp.]